MFDRLAAMTAFLAVSDHGSFTEAARCLSLSKAQVSKQVQALESHLGVRLLNRTTRRIALTELGQRYAEDCRRILGEIDTIETQLAAGAAIPRGLVRMTVPTTLGLMHLSDRLPVLLERHPELKIDLDFNDRYQNLVELGFDLAVRIGEPEDSSLVSRTLCHTRRVLVGAPRYLAAHGVPRSPADLAQHECLNFTYLERSREWRLRDPDSGDEVFPRLPPGRLRANNGSALAAAAAAGHGLLAVPDFIVAPHVRAGTLTCIMMEWWPPPVPIQVMYPPGRLMTAAQRAVIDFLVDELRVPPWTDILPDIHGAAAPAAQ